MLRLECHIRHEIAAVNFPVDDGQVLLNFLLIASIAMAPAAATTAAVSLP